MVANTDIASAGTRVAAPVNALVTLLALAIFINYIDRGNLATAAPLIQSQLHLSNVQIGLMTSAFFWTYTPAQLVSGWLAERLNPYRTLTLGFAAWSLATALTGLAGGFLSLIALRFLLGFGESVAFPCVSKLFAKHVPASALGMANGFTQAGIGFGPAVGTVAGGFLMVQFGWRTMFVVFGVLALFWLLPWLRFTRRMPAPAQEPADLQPPPPLADMLSLREMWGCIIGHFTGNYYLYFILSWLPLYLVRERGLGIGEMAAISGLSYALFGICSLAAGWLADRWIAAGASVNRVRKTNAVVGYLGIAVCLTGVALGTRSQAIAWLMLSNVFSGMGGTSLWAITQTIAGPRAAARWVGFQNCLANFAGIFAPLITGFIADRTGSFVDAFLVTSAVAVVGALAWGLMIPRVQPVDWGAV
ncbi:MAG: MFS transporter [Rhizomicrobium sp.]